MDAGLLQFFAHLQAGPGLLELGLQALADALQHWPLRPDADRHADYLVNAIVKFGTGGALFRNLYSGFLQWSRQQRPELVDDRCLELARLGALQWEELAAMVRPLVDQPGNKDRWQLARQQVLAAHTTESELFGRLADKQ